ncbi:MAG: right-handed parallel beta-helix repeat-containing protein [Candidatus Bathyarchaeota archaeon]|nr:MAG: right-handed parallel beta-helix repeat-containing protein [Candidatus Bathyarchaeota archaeon]
MRYAKLLTGQILIVIGFLAFVNAIPPLVAKAAYVEGFISQDVVWTRVDSPIIVSNHVIVEKNVTLTIEPGVEVRFGGNFSLHVEGQLHAVGDPDSPIWFTSNRETPTSGDWTAINFDGADASTLQYCYVEFATRGINVETASVAILDCIIRESLTGIYIWNSVVDIVDSEITGNTEDGIYLSGNNTASIQDCLIQLNCDGIELNGQSVSGVTIQDNVISSNTHSGINLATNSFYSQITILDNTVSTNMRGFQVSSDVRTSIYNNSICYNTVGVFYEHGQDHDLHWNDIYGNALGADISNDVTVDATLNYWGDQSGPYHLSMNPTGKGDPVGGAGCDLDFVFFLSSPIKTINERPIANLMTDGTRVNPGQAVTFIATTSSDDGHVDQYYFNFGDGQNSGWTTLSVFLHEYSSAGTYSPSVIVKDDFGVVSTNLAAKTINVQLLPALETNLVLAETEADYTEVVPVTVTVTDGGNPVENASIWLFALEAGSFSPETGYTNATGHFSTDFTSPSVTQLTWIRLIAVATKPNYADDSDFEYLTVQPPLIVTAVTDTDRIDSEEALDFKAYVTYNDEPVENAVVTLSSDNGGSFVPPSLLTDENGEAEFTYMAPQTLIPLNATITVSVEKVGYINGEFTKVITVEPKVLTVEITTDPNVIYYEPTANVTVHVTHGTQPVPSVTVELSADYGSLSPTKASTNLEGYATFEFTAPSDSSPLTVTLSAQCTKTGYLPGEAQFDLTIYLRALEVEIYANPSQVNSDESTTLTIYVSANSTPVEGARVEVKTDTGGFPNETIGYTDEYGYFTFNYTAPQTATDLEISMNATVSKGGYVAKDGRTIISVVGISLDTGSGIPWVILLAAVAVIGVVVVILVLWRLGYIQVTTKEKS